MTLRVEVSIPDDKATVIAAKLYNGDTVYLRPGTQAYVLACNYAISRKDAGKAMQQNGSWLTTSSEKGGENYVLQAIVANGSYRFRALRRRRFFSKPEVLQTEESYYKDGQGDMQVKPSAAWRF